VILSNICKGLRNENPYCIDLRFLGVEAWQRAEGINVVPRMVHQVQHFDVCSVVNNRQTDLTMAFAEQLSWTPGMEKLQAQ
jgi:hypothetical protein